MAHFNSSLSSERQHFIRDMQRINFGRIDGLAVRNGEPVLDPSPRKQVEIKFGGENGPRPELRVSNFALKQQVIELFELFDNIGDGTIDMLEIKHGLPFRAVTTTRTGRIKVSAMCCSLRQFCLAVREYNTPPNLTLWRY